MNLVDILELENKEVNKNDIIAINDEIMNHIEEELKESNNNVTNTLLKKRNRGNSFDNYYTYLSFNEKEATISQKYIKRLDDIEYINNFNCLFANKVKEENNEIEQIQDIWRSDESLLHDYLIELNEQQSVNYYIFINF